MVRYVFWGIIILLGGIAFGGYLFSDTKPRSFVRLQGCEPACLQREEILGLLGSVGVQRLPGIIPTIQKETDKTLVVKHPVPQADIHYVIIPKKDMRALEDASEEDAPYLLDALAVLAEIVREEGLRSYKIIVNGPGFQTVGYLHFHLVAESPLPD
jgi:histidine triad (HIT) family protein